MLRRTLALSLALVVATAGCGAKRDRKSDADATFTHKRADAVAVVVLDLSGSFEELLIGRDHRAFTFLTELIKQFFHDGAGYEQRLVIAQISGTDKALLFEGSIRDFNQQFPEADSFRDHLKRLKPPPGSRVYDSVREALAYTLGLPSVHKGHTKVGLFVLSDCDDNIQTAQSFPQLEAQLRVLAKDYDGAAAFYFVDQHHYSRMIAMLRNSGFSSARGLVTSEITVNPPIPKLLR